MSSLSSSHCKTHARDLFFFYVTPVTFLVLFSLGLPFSVSTLVFFAMGEVLLVWPWVTFLTPFPLGLPASVSTLVFFGMGEVFLVWPFCPPFFFFLVEEVASFFRLWTTSVTIMKEIIQWHSNGDK
jgi:hypothetical protein